jgi:hypothetical protein
MSVSLAPNQVAVSPRLAKTNHLLLDRDELMMKLNARACWVHHQLCDHPLFALPRLLELARFLPEKYVRINSGAVPVNATPDQIPKTGLTMEESFERIAASNTRIMLKKIELEPAYRDLLHTCLGELEALGHPCTQGIWAREGYVFISAPNQITPYHMDPEINFLLQVRGQKTFHVLPGDDRSILSEKDIEEFYSGHHDSLPFKAEWQGKAAPFQMDPGSGVHIPVNHPHWVSTSNQVTISFALTLQTAETQRRGVVYACNHYLRQRGFKPTPFGQSGLRDFVKSQGFRLYQAAKALLPGKRRPGAEH